MRLRAVVVEDLVHFGTIRASLLGLPFGARQILDLQATAAITATACFTWIAWPEAVIG